MARRRKSRRSRGLGSLGNVSATKALQSFIASVRSAVNYAQRAKASADPSTVIESARDAKKALADAQAAAAILRASGAFHSDYRGALRQAESAVADLASREADAARDARVYQGPDAYDPMVDGLAGLFGIRRRRCRRRC